jgi:hypothetical protein
VTSPQPAKLTADHGANMDLPELAWRLAPMRKRSGILDHIPGAPRSGKVIVDLDTGEITPLPVPEGGWASKDVAAVSLG